MTVIRPSCLRTLCGQSILVKCVRFASVARSNQKDEREKVVILGSGWAGLFIT